MRNMAAKGLVYAAVNKETKEWMAVSTAYEAKSKSKAMFIKYTSNTLEFAYRTAACPRGNLSYMRVSATENTVAVAHLSYK